MRVYDSHTKVFSHILSIINLVLSCAEVGTTSVAWQQQALVSGVGGPAQRVRLPKKCILILFQKGRLKRNMQSKGHTKTSKLPYWAAQMFCAAFRPHISF